MLDILIRNGSIIDGTGNPAYPGDVAIQDERIVAVGRLAWAEAHRVIDAAGRVVCPGFVDIHTHSDRTILGNRSALNCLYQGVTTEIAGNCGMCVAPVTALNRGEVASRLQDVCDTAWVSFGQYLENLDEGLGINLAVQVGHNELRAAAMVDPQRPVPSDDEMRLMERLTAESLEEGAIGLSFGLEFMPGRMSQPEELRRLCVLAAERERTTSWHVRNRDRRFQEAVGECLQVCADASARLQLAHLSAKPGSTPRAWNRVMEAVRLARHQGLDAQCDMIPYTVGPGGLPTILPDWATEGPPKVVQERLRDPKVRERLVQESDRYWLLFHNREWDKISLARCRAHPEWVGKTFREIGELAGKDPFDCVYDILADELDHGGRVGVNGILFSEGDIQEWLADPLFSIASDGWTVPLTGPVSRLANHPNCYGWAPRVIETYVRELRCLGLEEAIRKMTSQPASRFIAGRGLLCSGMIADVIVFDPERFRTRSTYLVPQVYAEGMDFVIVNGQMALNEGRPTDVLAGRVLRG